MPRSSHPAIPIVLSLLLPLGVAAVLAGVVAATTMSKIWWLGALMAVAGAGVVYGAVTDILRWRRSVQAEDATAQAMLASVQARAEGSTGLPAPVLVHWTYAPDEWRAYAEHEMAFRTREAVGMAAATVLFGTLAIGVLDGEWLLGLGLSGAIGAAIGLGRWLVARSARRFHLSAATGDVIIAPNAMLVNGRYQVLQDERIRFGSSRLLESERPAVLEITVMVPGRYRRIPEEYRIPVPRGKEDEARALMDALALAYPRPADEARRLPR